MTPESDAESAAKEPSPASDVIVLDGPRELHGRALAFAFVGLMLVMLMAALDGTIVATAMPTIARDLGGLNHISWVSTAYLLAETVVTPLYGKLGDLYGRRIVLQVGLIVFLVGSALCGLSQNFVELIVFRALQGLGGGGLMVSAQTAVADVVSPRQRGRYQGIFGGVFGVATVIGPLVGGFLTTNLSWRWVFYINLPIGVVAFVVLALTFPSITTRAKHKIDYLGTACLSTALAAIVLAVSLGGTTYPWVSGQIIGLGFLAVVALGVFVFVESRAAEPVLPPKLFSNSVFTSAGVVALFLGFAMFGTITFLPLYFQIVRGASPTTSGLELLPLMAGLLLTSTAGGMVVSKTGKYRAFPIAGTAVTTVGLFLLSLLKPDTSTLVASCYMFVAGLGIGLVMQVLVVAVQNAVGYEDLGVATSGNTLLRNIGSSLGTAIVGTVFATQLASHLRTSFPGTSGQIASDTHSLSSATLSALPAEVRSLVLTAYSDSLATAFRVAAFISLAAFVASFFIKQLPMRDTVRAEGIGEAFGAPRPPDSLAELARSLSVLVGREHMANYLRRIVVESGTDVPPQSVAALLRLNAQPGIDRSELLDRAREAGVADETAATALDVLSQRGLINDDLSLTDSGRELAEDLSRQVRARLESMLDGWSPEQYPDLVKLIDRMAQEIVSDPKELTASGPAAPRLA
jgi:EmrB/QacA subfamily drug resistance transporter